MLDDSKDLVERLAKMSMPVRHNMSLRLEKVKRKGTYVILSL